MPMHARLCLNESAGQSGGYCLRLNADDLLAGIE